MHAQLAGGTLELQNRADGVAVTRRLTTHCATSAEHPAHPGARTIPQASHSLGGVAWAASQPGAAARNVHARPTQATQMKQRRSARWWSSTSPGSQAGPGATDGLRYLHAPIVFHILLAGSSLEHPASSPGHHFDNNSGRSRPGQRMRQGPAARLPRGHVTSWMSGGTGRRQR